MAGEGAKIFLDVQTSGGTSFKINDFSGIERISALFEYRLVMTSQDRDLSFDSLMGQAATVSLTVGSLSRTYTGIIGRFEQDGTPFTSLNMSNVYKATLYPKLWLLTFSGGCRIFQNQSALDIVIFILSQNQIPFSNQVNTYGKEQREYCVQYNETDFNFISRLMEEEGIFYFFQQNEGTHTLVLADSIAGHPVCPNAARASFHDVGPHEPFMMKVSSCFVKQRIVPRSNTLKSFNYMTPQTPLKSLASGTSDAGGGEITTYDEIYGQQTYGDQLVKVKLQSEEAHQKMVEGISFVPFFLAGYKFTLEKHPRSDANVTYVLYEVIHEARILEDTDEPIYKNTYQAFAATIPFRAAQVTPKPRIYGTQTAKVTGKAGEEIYTEEYGRIKVKFHWDPSEKDDDTTSCWIRVATLWSGQQWGSLFTPRIGHEVVVSFIDGDPDKPLIIGSVYNGENKPPYLPEEPTKSTIKSQTSKKTGEATPGFNEFRFEDKQYAEEIYIHAQKDFTIDIQNNHDITIVGGNRTILLEAQSEQEEPSGGGGDSPSGNSMTSVSQNATPALSPQSNDSLTLNNGDKSLKIIKGDYTIQLDQGNITVTCLQGNVNYNVLGNVSFKCSENFSVDAETITLNAGGHISATAGADVMLTATADISAQAAGALTLTGGGTTVVTGATVKVNGAAILLNG